MKNLAIFDLDGTLIDSIYDLWDCVNKTFEMYSISPVSKQQCVDALGNGAASLIKTCLRFSGTENLSEDEVEKIIFDYNNIYSENPKKNTVPFEGILDMLKNLRSNGYKIGIISNKPHPFTLEISERLFGNLVDFIYGQSECFPRKPDPKIVIHAIKQNHFDISSSVFIGDSDTDIITAKNASITSIAVSWGYRPIETLKSHDPDFIAHSVCELENILINLNQPQ